jgi:hypothetical protein
MEGEKNPLVGQNRGNSSDTDIYSLRGILFFCFSCAADTHTHTHTLDSIFDHDDIPDVLTNSLFVHDHPRILIGLRLYW